MCMPSAYLLYLVFLYLSLQLINGYYGTELLPDGVTLNPSGPSSGAPQVATLTEYVDSWSVMFPSRLMNYFRIDILSDRNLGEGYPVREITLMNCRCAHGSFEDSGLVTWSADAGGWQQDVSVPLPLPDGIIRVTVKNGVEPIGYTATGSQTGVYEHIVGPTGDLQMDCNTVLGEVFTGCCLEPSEDCVPVHCSQQCASSLAEWQVACSQVTTGDAVKTQALLDLCQHASDFEVQAFRPSFFVPSRSPGLSTSVFACVGMFSTPSEQSHIAVASIRLCLFLLIVRFFFLV